MGTVIRSPSLGREPVVLRAPAGREARRPEAAPQESVDADAKPLEDPALQAALARVEELTAALTHVESELEALRARAIEEGRSEGIERGEREGRTRAESELREGVDRVTALAAELARSRALRLASEEDALVEVAAASVAKLLGEHMTTREGCLAAVRAVCRQVAHREQFRLRVAPDDHDLLRADPAFLASLGVEVSLEVDTSVAPGGCIVDCAEGTLDGRLAAQLTRLNDVLLTTRARVATDGGPSDEGEAP